MITAPKLAGMKYENRNWRRAAWVSFTAPRIHHCRIVAVQDYSSSLQKARECPHAQLVEAFQTEARAAGLLTHANIVVIYAVGDSDGPATSPWELVNGKSLQSLLDSGEKFAPSSPAHHGADLLCATVRA